MGIVLLIIPDTLLAGASYRHGGVGLTPAGINLFNILLHR